MFTTDLLIKKLGLLVFFLFTITGTYAQLNPKTKYYLNKSEIAPQSIQFLNVKDIDSIRYYYHLSAKVDTTVVLYTAKTDSLMSYDELMDYYFVEPTAKNYSVNTPNYLGVEEPFKMVFSENAVSNVHVYRSDGSKPGIVNISSEFGYLDGEQDIKRQMMVLINKFNNLPKPKK